MLVDSHCHLNFPQFENNLDDVIKCAFNNDVKVLQTICTKMIEFDDILKIANKYKKVYCSVGVHPHNSEDYPRVCASDIIVHTENKKVIGIGETGLDYFYEHSSREVQQQAFRAHIMAARETGLPIIVHTRDADDDTIAILREEMKIGRFKGLIHCFSSGEKLAKAVIDLGFYISISGIITFKKADELRAVVKRIPVERLLVETDAPYLAPIPHRGKTNEPAFTKYTAEYLADLKGISYEELAEKTTRNFFDLFSKAR